MTDTAPGSPLPDLLPATLQTALAAAADAPTLLVASDFDGVLSPLVVDALAARALPGSVEALTELAGLPDTWAAVVSGRDLTTLTALTGLEGSVVSRIGSHGAESSTAGAAPDLTDADLALLDDLEAALTEVAESHPGSGVESKPSARVLHTRGLDADAARAAEEAALAVGRAHGLEPMHGKRIVELAVVEADKGTALRALGEEVGAATLVYLGDDVTDENVFRVLRDGDVGIKVGDGDTAAGHRVADPEAVREVLATLARLRAPH